MLSITQKDIVERMESDNPWWQTIYNDIEENHLPRRSYFFRFFSLIMQTEIKRAVILMGPRRVGKTVMIKQAIMMLIEQNIIEKTSALFISVDTPVYVSISLEKIVKLFLNHHKLDKNKQYFVFFDEIQYLSNWEVHLKDLVDHYPNIKFIASGSAAATLKLKSIESGAGRFTDFILPPLTFAEFIEFSEKQHLIEHDTYNPINDIAVSIEKLNEAFVNYVNFGGYPEIVMNPILQKDTVRYIKQDIIDKVLLKDLPSLYGIRDTRELNKLFTVLAYNTANEVSLDRLSKESSINKEQVKKYIDYLEAAFLIVTVRKIDETGKAFKRQTQFKVYLTNPSIRAALFNPIISDDDKFGNLTETAIFSQWFHSPEISTIHYARWRNGEVDLVKLNKHFKPSWAYEIKWSDKFYDSPNQLKNLIKFSKDSGLKTVGCSTKTKTGEKRVSGVTIKFFPSSLHCYQVARRITNSLFVG